MDQKKKIPRGYVRGKDGKLKKKRLVIVDKPKPKARLLASTVRPPPPPPPKPVARLLASTVRPPPPPPPKPVARLLASTVRPPPPPPPVEKKKKQKRRPKRLVIVDKPKPPPPPARPFVAVKKQQLKPVIDRELPDDVLNTIKGFAGPSGILGGKRKDNVLTIWRENDGPHKLLSNDKTISQSDMDSVIKQLKSEGIKAKWTTRGEDNPYLSPNSSSFYYDEKLLQIIVKKREIIVVDDAKYKIMAVLVDSKYGGGIEGAEVTDKRKGNIFAEQGEGYTARLYQYRGVPMTYIKKLAKIDKKYETFLRIENGKIKRKIYLGGKLGFKDI